MSRTVSIVFLIGAVFLVDPPARGPSRAQADPPAVDEGRAVTLDQARALAYEHNPDLVSAKLEVEASRAAAKQAGAAANPELAWEIEDFGEGRRWSDSQTTFGLTQAIEPFGTRGARRDAARGRSGASAAALDEVGLTLAGEVERRFAGLLAAQMRSAIARENAMTADTVLAAVAALVDAGEVSPIELDRARADHALALLDERGAQAALGRARAALGMLWADPDPERISAVGSFNSGAAPPRPEQIAECALPGFEVTRRQAETAMREAEIRLAERSRLPAIVAGVGVRRSGADGARSYVASIALALPILDRRGSAIAEASARADQTRSESRSRDATIRGRRYAAVETLTANLAEARSLEEDVVPDLERAYRAIQEGYLLGKFRLIDVLDARRALAGVRLRWIDALESAAAARADLGPSLGESIDQIEEIVR